MITTLGALLIIVGVLICLLKFLIDYKIIKIPEPEPKPGPAPASTGEKFFEWLKALVEKDMGLYSVGIVLVALGVALVFGANGIAKIFEALNLGDGTPTAVPTDIPTDIPATVAPSTTP